MAEKKPGVQSEKIKKTKIRMIGLGGGGGTIVSEIATKMPKATFVAANTDLKALKTTSRKLLRFPFGQGLTHGLGTGMDVELGREAALSEKDKIKKLLEGQDLCILVASLGGGTGSGAAPIFAKISKKLGNLTYGIFTLPFKFEGEKKMEIAKESLKKVKNYLNAFSIIPNERVFQIIDKETPLKQALSTINKMLAQSLGGLIETIYEPGLINIDFADFKAISEGRGRLAYLNTIAIQRKKGSVKDLITEVLNSPLYPYTIRGAKGVLFNIAGEKDLSLSEVNQISKNISELVSPEAKIIFGISQGQKYSDIIKTTVLATGCGLKLFSSKTESRHGGTKVKKRTKFSSPAKKRTRRKGADKPVKARETSKTEGIKPSVQKVKKIKRRKTSQPAEKKIKKASKRRRPKSKKVKIKITKKPGGKENTSSETQNEASLPFKSNEETIRKSALQVKRESEELEKEMLAKEQVWESPAFLRKKLAKE